MGKALVVARLAVRDIRYRPAQAALLLLAIAAGAATLTLSLALTGTTEHPYARTRAATKGPDVVAAIFPNGSPDVAGPPTSARPGPGAASVPGSARARDLLPLERAGGVRAYSGPFPVTWTLLRTSRSVGSAEVEGRTAAPSSVDRPKLVQGSWIRPGAVVVEAAFADALGLTVGERLSLGGRTFVIAGTAISASIPDYPDVCSGGAGCFMAGSITAYNPGLVWATEPDAARIAKGTTSTPFAYFLNIKLTDPAEARAFADRYDATAGPASPYLLSWQSIRAGDAKVIVRIQQVLLFGGLMLALLAVASVAVLVGGRMAEQKQRVGLLKSIGATPGLVAAVLLLEHLIIALCAAGVGLLAGLLAAPLIDGPGAGLLGAASAPAVSGSTVALILALAFGVAVAATVVPAIRAARQSTVAALEDAARTPRRRPALITLTAHLPAPLLLGTRLMARRPRRLLLSVFSVAVTTTVLVLALIWHATAGGFLGTRVNQATMLISVMLILLAAVNTIFIGWATALETRRPAALAQALGATAGEITTGLSVSQLLPALAGTLLGIGAGIVIFSAPRNGGGPAMVVPAGWLAAMTAATLLAVAVLTAIPARIGARRPAADVLQSESA